MLETGSPVALLLPLTLIVMEMIYAHVSAQLPALHIKNRRC